VVSDLSDIPQWLGGTLQDLDYNWIEQQRLLEGRRTCLTDITVTVTKVKI
jgi:hypothetical protein